MFQFGRKKVAVPEWASVMGQKEYPLFISAVENYFEGRNEPYVIEDGEVRFRDSAGNFRISLGNLIQICAKSAPNDYPAIIANHCYSMIESYAFKKQFEQISSDFEKVRRYIGVKLYNKEHLNDTSISRPFAGEVFATLVYDLPQAIGIILRSDFERWGKTEDEIFDIGIENIRRSYELKATEAKFNEEDTVFIAEGDNFFVTNILFELEQHREFIGKGGAIIAIPTRSVAMIYPIHNMKVVGSLDMFFNLVPEFYKEGPGSLTREIYWYHDGQYEPLNYECREKIDFTPSEAFFDLLNDGFLE